MADPARRLGAAVLRLAVDDAQCVHGPHGPREDAIRFLSTDSDALIFWATVAGLDAGAIVRWARGLKGYPPNIRATRCGFQAHLQIRGRYVSKRFPFGTPERAMRAWLDEMRRVVNSARQDGDA